jgi:hypothetical protein
MTNDSGFNPFACLWFMRVSQGFLLTLMSDLHSVRSFALTNEIVSCWKLEIIVFIVMVLTMLTSVFP